MSNTPSTFGIRLRALRDAAKLTQGELSERSGIHRVTIARLEAGRHPPGLDTMTRLADALGVPVADFLAEKKSSRKSKKSAKSP